jgi:competence protein ComFC
MKSICRELLQLIYPEPRGCMLCQRPFRSPANMDICQKCLDRIPFITEPSCKTCGKPLRGNVRKEFFCSPCKNGKSHFFERGISVALYEGAMRQWIIEFKYHGHVRLAQPLGLLMAMRFDMERDFHIIEGVVPVPLSPRREAERGFNQAHALSKTLCKVIKKPLLDSSLIRVKDTHSQMGLSGSKRTTNLSGAFGVSYPGLISGKALLLVDDVYTTGTTADECSRTLLRAGALEVYVLTLALGIQDSDWDITS